MGKQNMTLEQLKAYDGKGTDGKIYVAVNGKIYDVTEKGQHLYGTGKRAHFVDRISGADGLTVSVGVLLRVRCIVNQDTRNKSKANAP